MYSENINKEVELILQDVTEEDFKSPDRESIKIKQNIYIDVGLERSPDRESIKTKQNIYIDVGLERFINIRYRQCPLTVNRNMNGLVDAQTFWRDSNKGRNGLYDTSDLELKPSTLQPVYFPTKHINMQQEIPNNDPAPISIMAQYLYDLMMKKSQECVHDVTTTVNVEINDEVDDINQSENEVKVKKSFKSKMVGFLKRLSCCHGNKEDMRNR